MRIPIQPVHRPTRSSAGAGVLPEKADLAFLYFARRRELTGELYEYMSNTTKARKPNESTDWVLKGIWRIKDTLSASYGYDVDRLFADARERQKRSGRPVVNLQTTTT